MELQGVEGFRQPELKTAPRGRLKSRRRTVISGRQAKSHQAIRNGRSVEERDLFMA
jgi:hypothetical protein